METNSDNFGEKIIDSIKDSKIDNSLRNYLIKFLFDLELLSTEKVIEKYFECYIGVTNQGEKSFIFYTYWMDNNIFIGGRILKQIDNQYKFTDNFKTELKNLLI